MYNKNLKQDIRIRVSDKDYEFLNALSSDRGQSVSELVRYIIGEYRRSMETMDLLTKALELQNKGGVDSDE